jgi:hypothetical protein
MLPGRAHYAHLPSASSAALASVESLGRSCKAGPPAGSARTARRRGGFGTPLPRWARIVFVSVLLTTAAADLVTRSLITLWTTRTRMEIEAVQVAAAGAAFLPGAPARASRAAARSAALRGLSPHEVTYAGASADRMSFSVTLRCMAPSLMLRMLRSAGVNVTATVRARPSAIPRGPDGAPMTLSAL